MASINSPFLTSLQFAFESKFYIVFIFDYCAGGELFNQIKLHGRINERDAKIYFAEICLGISYLH
jgi:serum/glucocorticoid-regulated kinase 2